MLADYKKPAIDENIQAALNEFVATRKASMPDEWY
jgi:trimethylamine--corrinoid protein Co-methyltransferase